MAFKPPGGSLSFWSALWVLAGILSCVLAYTGGKPELYVVGMLIGPLALGMWFEQRWCGTILGVLIVVGILGSLFLLVVKDATLEARIYRVLRMGLSGYFAYLCFKWSREE